VMVTFRMGSDLHAIRDRSKEYPRPPATWQ